jgi:hypothetical protein
MKKLMIAAALLAMNVAPMASAATGDFVVNAFANSTAGGTGVATFALTAGQAFTVTVAPDDLWNAGALPRWSNSDGLAGADLLYSSSTDGEVAAWIGGTLADGTVIGNASYGTYTQNGLTAPYGTLVGQFDSGSFFAIGTNYSGTATSAGTLKLFYFDSNYGDNAGSILAHVAAVPEPETYAMMLAGLGIVGFMAKRRRSA